MKPFDWNVHKSILLRSSRGIGFEEVVNTINEGCILAVTEHLNNQKCIINFDGYIYYILFIKDNEKIFLKTIYPSRKYANKFLKEKEGLYEIL